jgi:hypothetical protein
MWGVAGVAALILLLVLASGAHARERKRDEPPAPGGPPMDAANAVAQANATADPAKLDEHAANADRAGYPQTAAAIRDRAARLRAESPQHSPTAATPDLKSPLPEASDGAWTRFVELMAGNNATGAVSPQGNLGLFQFSVWRLADLGYVTNPHKDARGTWTADWIAPHTREQFLADVKLQYEAFVKATTADRVAIFARHADAIGRALAGKTATLSGLLAAVRQAGLRGTESWLASGADRTKFPRTTSAFVAANGVF